MGNSIFGDILTFEVITYIFRVFIFCFFLFFLPFRGVTFMAKIAFFVILLFALAPQSLVQGNQAAIVPQEEMFIRNLYFIRTSDGVALQYYNIARDIFGLSLVGIFLSMSFFIIQLFGKWVRAMFYESSSQVEYPFQGFRGFECFFYLIYLYLIFNVVGVERIIDVSQYLFYSGLIGSSGNSEALDVQRVGVNFWATILSRSFFLAFILSVPFFLSSLFVDISYFCFSRFISAIEVYGIYRITLLCLISSLLFMAVWGKFSEIIASSLVTKAFLLGS